MCQGGDGNVTMAIRRQDSETDIVSEDASSSSRLASQYTVRRSRLIKMINWWHVGTTFLPHVLVGLLCYLGGQVTFDLMTLGPSVPLETFKNLLATMHPVLFDMGWRGTFLLLCLVYLWGRTQHAVYLVDFSVFDPPETWKLTHAELMECMRRQKCFTEESLSFLGRVLAKSGTGPATAWPPGIVRCLEKPDLLADQSVEAARKESETVITAVVADVLRKTRVQACNIDILIVNCSLFSPTPSLCAMIMSKFDMRSDVMSYNLSGMGCSASLIAIEMAQTVLRSYPNRTALVVSTENLTQNLYHGNDRSMLLQNTLFRCGGAAIILSNKWWSASRSAKYKLLHVVRTTGCSKDSYEAVYECQDTEGEHGVRLSKDIVKVAGRTMEKNFTVLGPYVLPLSEQFKVARALIYKKFFRKKHAKVYVPDFKRGIDHWCIHAGGRAVVDGVVKNLRLEPTHAEPSRYALYKYGNTSSSSIWYELDYVRHYANQRRGHRVLQVAFGSGFKCNTAVWLCLQTPDQKSRKACDSMFKSSTAANSH